MVNIPDAPWIQYPEKYADLYAGKPIYTDSDEEENSYDDEDEEDEEDEADRHFLSVETLVRENKA